MGWSYNMLSWDQIQSVYLCNIRVFVYIIISFLIGLGVNFFSVTDIFRAQAPPLAELKGTFRKILQPSLAR